MERKQVGDESATDPKNNIFFSVYCGAICVYKNSPIHVYWTELGSAAIFLKLHWQIFAPDRGQLNSFLQISENWAYAHEEIGCRSTWKNQYFLAMETISTPKLIKMYSKNE